MILKTIHNYTDLHSPEAYESYWSKEEVYVLSKIFLAIDDHDDIKRLSALKIERSSR